MDVDFRYDVDPVASGDRWRNAGYGPGPTVKYGKNCGNSRRFFFSPDLGRLSCIFISHRALQGRAARNRGSPRCCCTLRSILFVTCVQMCRWWFCLTQEKHSLAGLPQKQRFCATYPNVSRCRQAPRIWNSTFSLSLSLLHHILVEVMVPTVPLHTLGMRLKPNPTKIPMLIFGAPALGTLSGYGSVAISGGGGSDSRCTHRDVLS